MALMYADGAMFLGNGTGTNEQSSLIGSTIKTFVSILAESNLLTVLANNDTVLTNEIIFASTAGSVDILANNTTVLTTQILGAILAIDNVASILPAKTLLTISITAALDEPAIKDITPSLSIIDSTDTYVESRIETEVL
jgi:hypothetical protein|tara:strand:- start:13374 stop:13790 length:417 start_codon:yes stop_codon:yes gene_type:complete